MKEKGKLIIFSAPSGAGKTTLVHHLLSIDALNLAFSVSACSRKKRNYEINGKDYYFLTIDNFKKKIENNEFIEWEEVYENQFYGTLKSEVERLLMSGKNVIFDIDVEGGLNIKKQFGNNALAIFVKPPSVKHLEERLKARSSEDDADRRIRLEKAVSELHYASDFDKVLLNERLDKAKKDAEVFVSDFLGINLD